MKVAAILMALAVSVAAIPVGAEGSDGEENTIRAANAVMMTRHYPRGALKRGEEGTVGVAVNIDRNGSPSDCVVTRSSGYRDLDNATCDVIVLYGKSKGRLSGKRRVAVKEEGQFEWRLPSDVAAKKVAEANSAAAGKSKASLSSTRLLCHSQSQIGSLVRRRKVCQTPGEWANQRDAAQRDAQDMTRLPQMGNN